MKLARNILEDELKYQVAEAGHFAGMMSKKQQKEAAQARKRKERLERLLQEAKDAERELAHPPEDIADVVRRVDRIRDRLQLGFVWQLEFRHHELPSPHRQRAANLTLQVEGFGDGLERQRPLEKAQDPVRRLDVGEPDELARSTCDACHAVEPIPAKTLERNPGQHCGG